MFTNIQQITPTLNQQFHPLSALVPLQQEPLLMQPQQSPFSLQLNNNFPHPTIVSNTPLSLPSLATNMQAQHQSLFNVNLNQQQLNPQNILNRKPSQADLIMIQQQILHNNSVPLFNNQIMLSMLDNQKLNMQKQEQNQENPTKNLDFPSIQIHKVENDKNMEEEKQQQQYEFVSNNNNEGGNFYFSLNGEDDKRRKRVGTASLSSDLMEEELRRKSTEQLSVKMNLNKRAGSWQNKNVSHKDSDKSACSISTIKISNLEQPKSNRIQSLSQQLEQITSQTAIQQQIQFPCTDNQGFEMVSENEDANDKNSESKLEKKDSNFLGAPTLIKEGKRKRSSQGEIYQLKQNSRMEDVYKRHGRNLYPYFGLHFVKDMHSNKEFKQELRDFFNNKTSEDPIKHVLENIKGKSLKTKKQIEETIMQKDMILNYSIKLWLSKYLSCTMQNTKDSHNNKIRETHEQRISAFTARSKQILQVLNECL